MSQQEILNLKQAVSAKIVGQHHYYDLDVDPNETENRCGERAEDELIDLLRTALTEVEVPAEQLVRLGI